MLKRLFKKISILFLLNSSYAFAQTDLKTIIAIQQSQLLNQQKMIQQLSEKITGLQQDLNQTKQSMQIQKDEVGKINDKELPAILSQINRLGQGTTQGLDSFKKEVDKIFLKKDALSELCLYIKRKGTDDVLEFSNECGEEDIENRNNGNWRFWGMLGRVQAVSRCPVPLILNHVTNTCTRKEDEI